MMDLFQNDYRTPANLLHKEGSAHYYGPIMPLNDANHYFNHLLHAIPWQNDQAIVFDKNIITKRKVAWYGDKSYRYTYSKITKQALPWTAELQQLKQKVEQETQETFNACLLNLYHDGSEGMAWHSDDEKDLKNNGSIASLSFGAERKFSFKHKQSQENISLFLQNGSLLVMTGCTQKHWLHRLPPTKTVQGARINLTFRTIIPSL